MSQTQHSTAVLFVEDEPLHVEMVQAILDASTNPQWTLSRAGSVQEAMQHLAEETPDVLLLDLDLSDSEGIDTFERIKPLADGRPIVVLSGLDDEDTTSRLMELGAQDFLSKSELDPKALIRCIKRAIDRQQLVDRTERLVEDLKRREENLRHVVSGSSDAMLVTDPEGSVLFANPAAADLFERPAHDLLGTRPELPLDPGGPRDVRFDRGPDEVRIASLNVVEIDWENSKALLATLQDVTERRFAESQIRSIEQRQSLFHRLKSVEGLARGVAHQFNNVIAAISGSVELAAMDWADVTTAPVPESMNNIRDAAARGAELTRQLVGFAGMPSETKSAVVFSDLIQDIASFLGIMAGSKCQLECDSPAEMPPFRADASQMRQAIGNLVSNAAEALGDGGGTIRITTGEFDADEGYLRECVGSEGMRPGSYVFLQVQDGGKGMERETIRRMFDPFFTTSGKGRGLGLAAVMGIVRGHGGGVHAASEMPGGSSIRLLFPITLKPNSTGVRAKPALLQGGTVLVVEDEEDVMMMTLAMLSRLGLTCLEARDGDQALKLFSENREKIDVVLLDLILPGMNGVDAYGKIRELDGQVPIIICSGCEQQEVMPRIQVTGRTDYLQKPYESRDLVEKLREILTKS